MKKAKPCAKSLANLRPPKKGEVRNPNGHNRSPVEMRMRKMAEGEIAEIGTLILDQNITALQEIIDDARGPGGKGNPDSKHSALKVWMAMIAVKGITKGDPYMLDAILNRVVGKVASKMILTGKDGGPIESVSTVVELTAEERRAQIAQYQKMLTDTSPDTITVSAVGEGPRLVGAPDPVE